MTIISEVAWQLLAVILTGILVASAYCILFMLFRIIGRAEWGGVTLVLGEVLYFDTDLRHGEWPLGVTLFSAFLTWAGWKAAQEMREEKRDAKAAQLRNASASAVIIAEKDMKRKQGRERADERIARWHARRRRED